MVYLGTEKKEAGKIQTRLGDHLDVSDEKERKCLELQQAFGIQKIRDDGIPFQTHGT